MKKLILVVVLLFALVGCTTADYLDNREQFMLDCQADPVCVDAIVSDADVVIAQTQTIADLYAENVMLQTQLQNVNNRMQILEDDLLLAKDDIIQLQGVIITHENEINTIQSEMLDVKSELLVHTGQIAELFTRVGLIERVLTEQGLLYDYLKTLDLHNIIHHQKVNPNDKEEITIFIELQNISAEQVQILKPSIENYLMQDLVGIEQPEKVIIVVKLSDREITKTLSDLLN